MPKRRASFWKSKWLKKISFGFIKLSWKVLPWGLAFGLIGFFSLNLKHTLHADPYFRLEAIKVYPSGILTAAEHQFLESKARNQSLFDIHLKEIANHLERNPKVKRAEVIRAFPNQLSIFLATRSPLIQVQLKANGPYFLVASDQLVLFSQKTPRPDLVTIEDFHSDKKSYSIGSLYQNQYFFQLFDIIDAVKNDPILVKQNVSKISLDQLGNMILILQDGIELRIGTNWSVPDSVRVVLSSFLNSEQRNEILYVDMRYRDIIVKKKSQE